MDAQGAKLNAFLTMGFGGPDNYSGKDLREGHRHLLRVGLNDGHFRRGPGTNKCYAGRIERTGRFGIGSHGRR